MASSLNNVAYRLWLYQTGLRTLQEQFDAQFAGELLHDVCSFSVCYMVETKATPEQKVEIQKLIDDLVLLTTNC